ncbi:MAG: hypothetical protein IJW78_06015 [Clostridia bacterium]|nr:hypothetical protein [Clostridia bacterium]MBQ7289255.1 hypothetical protein [Clostridia bacterium]
MKKIVTLFVAVMMVVSIAVSASAANSPVAPTIYSVQIFNDVDTVKTAVKVAPVTAGDTLVLTADSKISGFQTWDIGSATLISGALTDTTITIQPTADTKVYAVYSTGAAVIECSETGVVVIVPQASAPDVDGIDINTLVLKVEKVTSGTENKKIADVLKDVATNILPYDITLLYNNVPVQPTGMVKVKLPIPSTMNPANVVVYYVDDNKKTLFPHTLSDDFAVIETDHFSYYVLTEKVADDGKAPQTGAAAATLGVVMMLSAVGFVVSSKK